MEDIKWSFALLCTMVIDTKRCILLSFNDIILFNVLFLWLVFIGVKRSYYVERISILCMFWDHDMIHRSTERKYTILVINFMFY